MATLPPLRLEEQVQKLKSAVQSINSCVACLSNSNGAAAGETSFVEACSFDATSISSALKGMAVEIHSLRKLVARDGRKCRSSKRGMGTPPQAEDFDQLVSQATVLLEREELADGIAFVPQQLASVDCAQVEKPAQLLSPIVAQSSPTYRKFEGVERDAVPMSSGSVRSGDACTSNTGPSSAVYKALTQQFTCVSPVLSSSWTSLDKASLQPALVRWEESREKPTTNRLSSHLGSRLTRAVSPSKPEHHNSSNDNSRASRPRVSARKSGRRQCCWTLHPVATTRILWDGFCLLILCIDLLGLPLLLFDVHTKVPVFVSQAVSWFHAAFWSVDMLMSFRTGFAEGPVLVLHPAHCALHYLKTWFAFDLILVSRDWVDCILQLITPAYGKHTLDIDLTGSMLALSRLLLVVRVIKLPLLVDTFEEWINSPSVSIVMSVGKLSVILGIAVHFITCAWWGVGNVTAESWARRPGPIHITPLEVVQGEEIANKGFLYQYSISARWALAQVNGRVDQDPDRTVPEMAFTCLVASFTVLIMSIFIGLITTRMMELRQLMDEANKNSRALRTYLEQHSTVSLSFAYYAKKHVKGQERITSQAEVEQQVLRMLPAKLQKDLLHEVRSPLLMRHSLFKDVDDVHLPALKHLCTTACSSCHITSTETVLERGDTCTRVTWVLQGSLCYQQKGTRKKIAFRGPDLFDATRLLHQRKEEPSTSEKHVTEGAWFSEPALCLDWRNVGDMTAVKRCELVQVESTRCVEVLRQYSEASRLIELYGVCYQTMFSRLAESETDRNDLTHLEVGSLIHLVPDQQDAVSTPLRAEASRVTHQDDEQGCYLP